MNKITSTLMSRNSAYVGVVFTGAVFAELFSDNIVDGYWRAANKGVRQTRL